MQSLSAKALHGGFGLRAQKAGFGLETSAVSGVAQDWMADMGHMNPDLVGAAGF